MNDSQLKKVKVIGLTTFIVWFFVGIANGMFNDLLNYGLEYPDDVFKDLLGSITGTWYQIILFTAWVGSLVTIRVFRSK